MTNLNEVNLIGRIGSEPEISRTDNRPIARLSIATSESWNDKFSNERKERTEWHKIVIYNAKLAEIIENRKDELKGALIYVSGKIRYEKWVDSAGKDQKNTQIILDATGQLIILSKTNSSEQNQTFDNDQTSNSEQGRNYQKSQSNSDSDQRLSSSDEDEDNLPF